MKVVLAEEKLTAKWLAEQIGKSENTMSKCGSNEIQPSLETLFEIAHVPEVEVHLLLFSTND
ncbi:helix-turn-helix domain-containing protein [Porphyromonas endodontalis]|uniref:helix-turn-helix domain-containing protein n=1 Tax=Porphyromonas endodontalis TaxID=28124 RepID=UPI0028807AD7|nr:helix-turn-helix transcriptional regulator [Porphyromonas endodontalis]